MAELVDLVQYIKSDNHKAFLEAYLELLVEGYTLSIPTETSFKEVQEGWQQILVRLHRNFTDEFLDQLSKQWIQLMRKQGGKIHEKFADELFEIFTHGKKLPPKKEEKPQKKPQPLISLDALNTQKDPLDDDVQPQISDHYYKVEDARQSEFPDLPTLEKRAQKALKNKDVDGFLIAYLSRIMHGEKPTVPLSSVLHLIKHHWEDIFVENGYSFSEEFVEEICTRWFYLMNQYGLPVNTELLKSLLFELISGYSEPQYAEMKPRKNMFRKFFGKK